MKIIKTVLSFFVLAGICCCTGTVSQDNKKRLEAAVCGHYTYEDKDSLKLAAAKFLFRNMDGHFSIQSDDYLQKIRQIKQMKGVSYFDKKNMELTHSYYTDTDKRLFDTDVISPDFLIRHIDGAFEQRKNCPWLWDINDEDFYEYLLPYRFLNEVPDYWRDSLSIAPNAFWDMSSCDNLKYYSALVYKHLYNDRKFGSPNGYAGQWQMSNMDSEMSCYASAAANLLKYRSLGIPSAIDFTPAYANRNGLHCWVSVISSDEKYCKLEIEPGRRVSKVYRYMYSKANHYADFKDEYIPELFRNPFIKDVTALYLHTRDVTVPVSPALNTSLPELCYLAVFNAAQWQPVAIAKRKRKSVTFGNIPAGNIYLPVCRVGDEWVAVNYPFIISGNSRTDYFAPDNNRIPKMRIFRKYPYSDKLNKYCKSLEGMKIVGSNDRMFKESRLLCVLRSDRGRQIYDNRLNLSRKFRYLKFVPAKPYYNLGEVILYGDSGVVISKSQTDACFKNVVDNNPLTYVHNTDIHEKELIIDLTDSFDIKRIVCLPRSDGNQIYPGNTYELLYFDLGGWQPVDIKQADDYYLEYGNVPAGALYWLRCLDGGSEDRIFTYKNGILRFF